MKSIGVVVTYNPDDGFLTRLEKMSIEFDQVVIVDNFSARLPEYDLYNVVLLRNSSNCGIATALNQGIVTAAALGAQYICLFDQDTNIQPGFSKFLIDGFISNEKVGIVAANYSSPVSKRKGYEIQSYDQKYVEVKHAITSGSMINVEVFKICGGMRDDYFIDYVDIEFSERVREKNFKIFCTTSVLMIHPIGEATNHKILSYKLSASNHSPLRRYYMARNCTYSVITNMFTNRHFSIISFKRLLKFTAMVVLFEKNKLTKMKAIFLGMYDGFLKNMGRTTRSFQ